MNRGGAIDAVLQNQMQEPVQAYEIIRSCEGSFTEMRTVSAGSSRLGEVNCCLPLFAVVDAVMIFFGVIATVSPWDVHGSKLPIGSNCKTSCLALLNTLRFSMQNARHETAATASTEPTTAPIVVEGAGAGNSGF